MIVLVFTSRHSPVTGNRVAVEVERGVFTNPKFEANW